jgi:type I restriction enzyme, S subunit
MLIDGPQYGTAKKCFYNFDGTGVLRIPNISIGAIDPSDLKGEHFDPDELEIYALQRGDLLLVRSNGSVSIVGKCAVVSEREEQYLYTGYLIRIRPNDTARQQVSSHDV